MRTKRVSCSLSVRSMWKEGRKVLQDRDERLQFLFGRMVVYESSEELLVSRFDVVDPPSPELVLGRHRHLSVQREEAFEDRLGQEVLRLGPLARAPSVVGRHRRGPEFEIAPEELSCVPPWLVVVEEYDDRRDVPLLPEHSLDHCLFSAAGRYQVDSLENLGSRCP